MSIDPMRPREVAPEPEKKTVEPPSRLAAARSIILFGTLAAVVVGWGLLQYQQRRFEAAAAPLVEQVVLENSQPGLDVVSRLTVSREALFYGAPHAKVEVFVREAGDAQRSTIRGIEYHYALQNGSWRLEDSGSCTSEQCTLRGREAFENR